MTDADKLEVTQADREAAANGAVLMEMRDLIRTGRADHHAEIFARYRITSVAAATTIAEPNTDGGFVGDIWYGDPNKRTLGTHRWTGLVWEMLPSELEAVLALLAEARDATAEKDAEIARLKAERSPTPSLTEQLCQIVTGLRPKPSCLRAAERGYFFGYNTALAERDQLRAKLDAATTRLEYLADAIVKGEDGFDNLDGRMCCSGQMCGCGGWTNADHIVYLIRDFLSSTAASKDG